MKRAKVPLRDVISGAGHAATIPMINNSPSPVKHGLLYLLPEPKLNLLVEPSKPIAELDVSDWLSPHKDCVQFSANDHTGIRLELIKFSRSGLDEIRLD